MWTTAGSGHRHGWARPAAAQDSVRFHLNGSLAVSRSKCGRLPDVDAGSDIGPGLAPQRVDVVTVADVVRELLPPQRRTARSAESTMPNKLRDGGGLEGLAVAKARADLRNGDPDSAFGWLMAVPAEERPKSLEAAIRYSRAKLAASSKEWDRCERELKAVRRLDPDSFYAQRLALVRRRGTLLDDSMWRTMRGKIDPARRLRSDLLMPAVSSVWACGAYHSRGHGRGLPWSRLLREAKNPPRDEMERGAILKVTSGYLCRYTLVVCH